MRRGAGALGLPMTPEGAAAVAAILADPAGALIATDFDGTLAPIVADPGAARPAPGAVEALALLAGHVGHIVVITGRPAQLAVDLGGMRTVPGAVVLGLYGAERWQAGTLTRAAPPDGLAEARRAVERGDRCLSRRAHRGQGRDLRGAYPQVGRPIGGLRRPSATGRGDRGRIRTAGRTGSVRAGAARSRPRQGRGAGVVRHADRSARRGVLRRRPRRPARVRRGPPAAGRGVAGLTVASRSDEAPAVAEDADLVVDGPSGVVDFLQRLLAAL